MEFVYVVERERLFPEVNHSPATTLHGFVITPDFWLPHYGDCIRHHGFFMERDYAEKHSDYKQIIPYSLVVKIDDDFDICVFCYQRLKGGGEKRLHNLFSIGVGGHINPIDSNSTDNDPIIRGSIREVNEELILEDNYKVFKGFLGVINDDTNPVGSVHFGVIPVIWVRDAKVKEKDNIEGSFVKLKDLDPLERDFETWSQLILELRGDVEELLTTRLI